MRGACVKARARRHHRKTALLPERQAHLCSLGCVPSPLWGQIVHDMTVILTSSNHNFSASPRVPLASQELGDRAASASLTVSTKSAGTRCGVFARLVKML